LKLLPQAPEGLSATVQALDSPGALADLAAALLDVPPDEKQEMLETGGPGRAARPGVRARSRGGSRCCACPPRSAGQTRASLDQRQREAILREQMASIQRQLGEDEGKSAEIKELGEAIAKAGCRRRWSRPRARSCAGWSGCRRPRPSTAWSAPTSTG
jgi:ATP-dependent Lon protease